MEDDVDIYADLPSFNADPEKNDQNCNCEGLKKELSSLVSKLENIQRIKVNLENNLSSLLKTAKAEIARKDKMIDDLRKRLDDAAFRRNNRNESVGFPIHRLSHQHTVPRKYENVPSAHSQESEIESYQTRSYHDEYKSKKPQREDDVNRIPTVFGERLHKRIMEDEKEERKQKASLKLSAEVKTKDIPKENIMENDKENGSQFSINNNGNESNTRQQSSSEPSYRKNSVKRTNEEDDTRRNKRLKMESNEDKSTTEENDYNCITRYDQTDNPAQYEVKASLAKFEDRLQRDAGHSLRKEETPLRSKRRAASEHQDTKQRQSCTNGRKSEVKNLAKDYDSSSIRDGPADSLRNSRIASTSNHVSERLDSGYKNGYRYSPPRRNYSRSRSDYESSSSHRLRERSNRTYREKKYDDHKYESRYKTDRLKRNYDSEENDNKTRYRCGERGDLRDKSRYSSSDAEDRESSSSYKNKKYENRRIKKANVLNDRKSHKSNKAATEIDFRESSSRTIVNTAINYNADKNSEQHKIKNESEIKSTNSTESTSTHIVTQNLNTLEEGKILDSPEKKNNFVKISKNIMKNRHKNNKNNVVKIENKNKKEDKNVEENNKKIENVLVTPSIDDKLMPLQNDANQLESTDISTKKSEIVSQLLQENSKDYEEKIPLNSSKSDMAVYEMYNCIKDVDTCESNINEDLIDSATHNIGTIKQLRDNDADKESKHLVIETIIKIKETTDSNVESVTKIKETADSNVESVTEIKELDDPNIETVKKEEMDNPDIESVEIAEVNSYSNSSHKIDSEELRTSTAKVVTKVEAVLNCDIEDKDKSQIPNGSETFHQMSNKNNIETCLNDHNYVQNPPVNISDFDATQKPSSSAECSEAILETVTPKETKVEETMNVQSVGVKKTGSIVKNKKDQQSKGILISHRRRAVILSDSNASMTMLMNTNVVKTSPVINNCNDNDSILKPRACKTLRVSAKAICK